MFKVFVLGKSIDELKANLKEMHDALKEGDDDTNYSRGSQIEHQPAAPISRTATETRAAEQHMKETVFATPSVSPFGPGNPNVESVLHMPQGATKKIDDLLEFGVDSRGLPWDARIHAVTQGVNKDGSWRNRRGVEDALLASVETELRQKMATRGSVSPASAPTLPPPIPSAVQPIAPPVMLQPIAPTLPPLQPSPPVVPVMASQPAPVPHAPVQPVAPAIPINLSVHNLQTFQAQLVPTLAKLVEEGKLTKEYVQQLEKYFGVTHIFEVSESQCSEMFEGFVNAGLLVKAT